MGLGEGGRDTLVADALATIGTDATAAADPLLRSDMARFQIRARAFAAMSERFLDE